MGAAASTASNRTAIKVFPTRTPLKQVLDASVLSDPAAPHRTPALTATVTAPRDSGCSGCEDGVENVNTIASTCGGNDAAYVTADASPPHPPQSLDSPVFGPAPVAVETASLTAVEADIGTDAICAQQLIALLRQRADDAQQQLCYVTQELSDQRARYERRIVRLRTKLKLVKAEALVQIFGLNEELKEAANEVQQLQLQLDKKTQLIKDLSIQVMELTEKLGGINSQE
ncbi:hypothetical protein HDU83_006540 [Entophlyctis luteolus]|nr:hypothetical protein HDU83_006540 [Entophlyctis luteolus]